VGKSEGNKSLRWPRRMWVDNIKTDLRDIGWGGMVQDRDQWRALCEHRNVLSCTMKCWEIVEWLQNWEGGGFGKGSSPLS
jgi:hypothetical protein